MSRAMRNPTGVSGRNSVDDLVLLFDPELGGDALRKRTRRFVFRRRRVAQVHVSQTAFRRNLTESPQRGVLHAAAEHATTQQQRIDNESRTPGICDDFAHQSVVAEPILDGDAQHQ